MRRLPWIFIAFVIAVASPAIAAGDAHLLAGARLFRDGHFQQAYVEFSVARRLGEGGEAAWYEAAALVKLKRPEDAIEAFATAVALAPEARDPLLEYYRALACYDARLYLCADHSLAAVEKSAGPKIAAQARKTRADIAGVVYSGEPAVGAIDWYHLRGTAALRAGLNALAGAYFTEAAGLAQLRRDRYRLPEATAGAESARTPARENKAP